MNLKVEKPTASGRPALEPPCLAGPGRWFSPHGEGCEGHFLAWLSLSARHNGAHKVASWLRRGLRPHILKVHFFPRGLERRCSKARGSGREPAGGQPLSPSQLGLQRRRGLWALKGSPPSAEHPVCGLCLPARLNLLPTVLPQGEERAQLQTELPRDMVAAGYSLHAPHRRTLHMFC